MPAMHPTAAHIGLNAHLLTAQAGYRGAGINGYIAHLLRALPEADPALRYTLFVGAQAEPPTHPRMAVRRTRARTESALRRILWEQAALPVALARLRPDLLHALAFVAPLLGPVRAVVTVYDLSFEHFPDRLPAARRWYLRLLGRRTAARAARVIAISHSTARDLAATWGVPPERIDVAAPGVAARFRPLPLAEVAAFRAREGLPERFFLTLGTLEPRKNLPLLLRAYARLPEADRAAAPLLLAGAEGWMVDEVRRALETPALRGTVRRVGYVPDADLPLWYNAASWFVYPSLFEGFGLPIVEALACGTPVLAADTSALPEALGDGGCLLPPGDELAWADALDRARRDRAWRDEASARGQAHAAQFTWARTAAATVSSYRRALGLPLDEGAVR